MWEFTNMFLLYSLGWTICQLVLSSIAVKMVWKLLKAKTGYDLLHDFRYSTAQRQLDTRTHAAG